MIQVSQDACFTQFVIRYVVLVVSLTIQSIVDVDLRSSVAVSDVQRSTTAQSSPYTTRSLFI